MNVVFSRLIRSFLLPASVSSRILAWSSSVSLPPRSIPFGVSTVTSPTVRTSRLIVPPSPPARLGTAWPRGVAALLLGRPARFLSRARLRSVCLTRAPLRRTPRFACPERLLLLVLANVLHALRGLLVAGVDVENLVECGLRLVDLAAVRIGLAEPDEPLHVLGIEPGRPLQRRDCVRPVLLE